MKRIIIDHIEFNEHRSSLEKMGIDTIKKFRQYLKRKGWIEKLNYWEKQQ